MTGSAISQRASLHSIAPRLAVARDVRKWVRDSAEMFDGQDWAEVLDADHTIGRCLCGATEDRYVIRRKFLRGCNAGVTDRIYDHACRACGRAGMSNWRRPW